MNIDKLRYIEDTGLLFDQFGLTRMAGRVFGYLIVCDEDHVSFHQIKESLQASKGSISGTMKQLQQMGMVEALSLPGDRKTYYRISKVQIGEILRARVEQFINLADILDRGGQLKDREDETSIWLTEASTFYNWIGDRIDDIINQWEIDKDKIIRQYHEDRKKNPR